MYIFIAHARNSRISTSGLKSEVTCSSTPILLILENFGDLRTCKAAVWGGESATRDQGRGSCARRYDSAIGIAELVNPAQGCLLVIEISVGLQDFAGYCSICTSRCSFSFVALMYSSTFFLLKSCIYCSFKAITQ